jgi:hypothetical protein
MTRSSLPRLVRDAEAPVLFESFFVAAVASFLGIRAFLAATGYPRIGSNGLHIAHMLWGGLLLLLAVLLLLAFLDRSVTHGAAVVAGLGFGTFIDEIGKFVTADNDYFYRPAIALIYGVFVIAFLAARLFVGQRRLTSGEALANALDRMAGAPARGLEPDDRAVVRALLDLADPADPRTAAARAYLAAVPAVADHDTIIETIGGRLAAAYERVMALPAANRVLAWAVGAYAVVALVGVGLVALAPGSGQAADATAFATIAQVGSTVVGAALIGRGILSLRHDRLAAYHWFLRGLLVWILVTQVFVFYSSQLGGLLGLVPDLVAYGSVRYAIGREHAVTRRASTNPGD